MAGTADVVVLGAGLAGAALAFHLAERGAGTVVVYDPRTPAAGATGRAAGIVTEQMWNAWDVGVVRDSAEEYRRLARAHEPSAYRTNGFVRWSSSPEGAEALTAAVARLRGWGVKVRAVDPSEVGAMLPSVRTDGIRAASLGADDAVITPSALTEAYLEEGRPRGVVVRLGEPFRGLRPHGDSWRLVTAAGELRARHAVIAAGAWSKRLLADAGHPLPLAPYLTQAAELRPTPAAPDFPSAHDIDLDVYLRPEENGRLLAGDGTRLEEIDPEAAPSGGDAAFLAHLAESFAARFPGWAESELVRAWAGVCVSTPDRRPLIGPVAGAPGLFVITGFNGYGVMRAGGAARRLAELMTGDGAADAANRLREVRPDRFGPDPPPFRPQPGFTVEAGDHPRF